jgi:hypothetical protein
MPPRTDVKGIDGLPVIDAKTPSASASPSRIATRRTRSIRRVAPPPERFCGTPMPWKRAFIWGGCTSVATRAIGSGTKRQRYKTPLQLRAEIIAFDRGGTFEPGEFVLSVVPEHKRPTGRRQGSKKGDEKGARQNRKKKRPTPISVKNVRTGPA